MWNKAVWKRRLDYLAFLLFGKHCLFCGKPLPFEEWYCPECGAQAEKHWFWECPLCGAYPCECSSEPSLLDGVIARVDYQHGGKEAVLALKSGARPSAAIGMGWMMTAWMEEEDWLLIPFDLILPVPSASGLLREKGEHAYLLAKQISRCTGIPCWKDYLRKKRFTRRQHTLSSASEREKNLNRRLLLYQPESFLGKRILLVDDVITTGTTMMECARVLKNSGAQAVYAIAFCRTRRRLERENQHSSWE